MTKENPRLTAPGTPSEVINRDPNQDTSDPRQPATDTDQMLAAALRYATAGWSVFPLQRGTKVPLKGSRGFLDATRNETKIRRAWAKTPGANIGLAVPRGFVVIDADLYKPGATDALARLERELGQLPPSPTVRTARGGLQFWFRCPADAALRATAAPGIDIRAGGKHYVVAPPSVVAGGRYEWL